VRQRRSIELERRDIFFFYRPRVGVPEVKRLEDVQRFFFILHPGRGDRLRRIVVGSKRRPDPERHERSWAFVADVVVDPSRLRDELRASAHETKTRGTRIQPQARPAGEGRHAIVDHDGHRHLAYVLELPQHPRWPSRLAARRSRSGCGSASADGGSRRSTPPEWLDHERTELVLIGAARTATREPQIDLDPEEQSIDDADLFGQLRIGASELATQPLRGGALE
jgi:hypothetical protein